jgi:hypothetical protein
VATHFSRLLRQAWVTVGLFLIPGHHTGQVASYGIIKILTTLDSGKTSLLATASRPTLGPIQPPIQWILEALSARIKRPGREAGNSPPSSTEVKNEWSYTSTRLHGVVLN